MPSSPNMHPSCDASRVCGKVLEGSNPGETRRMCNFAPRCEVAEVRNSVARGTQGDLFHPGIDRPIETPNAVGTSVSNFAKVSTTNR